MYATYSKCNPTDQQYSDFNPLGIFFSPLGFINTKKDYTTDRKPEDYWAPEYKAMIEREQAEAKRRQDYQEAYARHQQATADQQMKTTLTIVGAVVALVALVFFIILLAR